MKNGTVSALLWAVAASLFAAGGAAAQEFMGGHQFGGLGRGYASGVCTYGAAIYVTGHVEGLLRGGSSYGQDDAFLIKYDMDGNEVWVRQFGTSADDSGSAVFADANGVYVSGTTWGQFPGETVSGFHDAFVSKYDSDGNGLWTRQFGSPSYDWGRGVCADSSGVYVSGRTEGALPGQTLSGFRDAFLRKYNFSGVEQWTRQFGTSDSDYGEGASADSTGVYVTGYTEGTFAGQTSAGSLDGFVRKYNSAGTVLWTHQFGTSTLDYAYGVSADSTDVYVAGYTAGTFPGQTSAGFSDVFVMKCNSSGTEQWTRQFGSSASDYGYSVSAHAGEVYVGGQAFVSKYNSSGTEQWTQDLASPSLQITTAWGVAASPSGVCLAGGIRNYVNADNRGFIQTYGPDGTAGWGGEFGAAVPWDMARSMCPDTTATYVAGDTSGCLPGQTKSSGVGYTDAFVRKYDPDHYVLWTAQFGTSTNDQGTSVATYGGGVYVGGYTEGTLPGESSAGGKDAFVRKYDSSGVHQWTDQFGTSSSDYAHGICADSSGIYVAGFTLGTLPGQTSAGGSDAFVRKYSSTGSLVWTRQFGSSGADYAYGICVDSGYTYVVGYTEGALPSQTSKGDWDAFVRKYNSSGTEQWTRQFGGSGSDHAVAVGVYSAQVYIAGHTYGALLGETHIGYNDAFVKKYNSSGSWQWTRQFGTTDRDYAAAVCADSTGVYVAGGTEDALPGQTSAGLEDAFARKYSTTGTLLWTHQYGTSSNDSAEGACVYGSVVHVSGDTPGNLLGQPGAGLSDAYVLSLYSGSGPTVAAPARDMNSREWIDWWYGLMNP